MNSLYLHSPSREGNHAQVANCSMYHRTTFSIAVYVRNAVPYGYFPEIFSPVHSLKALALISEESALLGYDVVIINRCVKSLSGLLS